MEEFNQITQTLALSMGVAWASGINLYAAIFMLGLLGSTGEMTLPANLEIVTHPAVMTAAGLMFCVEFFADKVPGVDSGWDGIHTFIRIPAGAVLAAAAFGDVNPAITLSAAIVGGGITGVTHATKASTRLLINSSPEPVSNWTASVTEDVVVVGGVWAALNYPWLFFALFALFTLLVIWLLPRVLRMLGAMYQKVKGWFSSPPAIEHKAI